jgi:hypothetical protein
MSGVCEPAARVSYWHVRDRMHRVNGDVGLA